MHMVSYAFSLRLREITIQYKLNKIIKYLNGIQ